MESEYVYEKKTEGWGLSIWIKTAALSMEITKIDVISQFIQFIERFRVINNFYFYIINTKYISTYSIPSVLYEWIRFDFFVIKVFEKCFFYDFFIEPPIRQSFIFNSHFIIIIMLDKEKKFVQFRTVRTSLLVVGKILCYGFEQQIFFFKFRFFYLSMMTSYLQQSLKVLLT